MITMAGRAVASRPTATPLITSVAGPVSAPFTISLTGRKRASV